MTRTGSRNRTRYLKAVDGEISIRELRQQLIRARQECDPDLLQHVLEGVSSLAGDGYRCCLVDYSACKPAAYVRVVGFEHSRVRAQLEFPIDPGLSSEQWLPLSHLADYEEAADSESIRRIYDGVSAYVHRPEAELVENAPRPEVDSSGAAAIAVASVPARRSKARRQGKPRRGNVRRPMPRSHIAWWFFAVALMAASLTLFVGASRTVL